MDIRDRRLKARLSKWSTCSVETKRGLVKPRKVIMLKRFLSYYKPQMGLFVADTVCALVLAAIDLAFPIILRNLTGGLFTQGQAAIMQALGMIAVGLVLMYVIRCACRYFVSYWGHVMGARMESKMREDLFDQYERFSFAYFDRNSSGDMMSRVVNDLFDICEAAHHVPEWIIICGIEIIGSFVILFTIAPVLALAMAVVTAAFAVIMFWQNLRMREVFSDNRKKISGINAQLQDSLAGMRVVKSYVREDFEKEKFATAARDVQMDFTRAEKLLAFNNPMMNICVNGAFVVIIYLGSKLIITSQGTLFDVGQLSSTFTYGFQILMSLMQLSMIFVMVTMADESAHRITEVLAAEPTIADPAEPVLEVADGSIDFDHVSFKYSKHAKRQALDDIDLHITSGETIGIIGGTGSAKSTLVNLIARLYDTTEGAVRVGGVDVRDYDLDALRHQVAMVLQKNVLFSGTIAENLRWGDPNATDEEVREAAHLACADEFVDGFPKGYDTWIEQGGSNVSGGQKQRLCIARALLRRPKILILDDSTSAVDTKTDAKIRAGLASYLPNTTKLIIAQRISSVQDADRIIVMEGGRIAQIGNHDELLKTSEIYRETFTSQNKMSAEGTESADDVSGDTTTAADNTDTTATQAQTQEGGEAHE